MRLLASLRRGFFWHYPCVNQTSANLSYKYTFGPCKFVRAFLFHKCFIPLTMLKLLYILPASLTLLGLLSFVLKSCL